MFILYYFEWKSTTFGALRLLRRVYQAWPTWCCCWCSPHCCSYCYDCYSYAAATASGSVVVCSGGGYCWCGGSIAVVWWWYVAVVVLWWYCRDDDDDDDDDELSVTRKSFYTAFFANNMQTTAWKELNFSTQQSSVKNMHQRVYQPNPARANRSNSARYSQGHGIWAFQTIQFFWRMNVVQSRDNPSWQEGQQHFHKLKTTCSQSVDLIAYSVDLACFIIFIANLVQRCQKAPVKLPTSTRYRDIRPCKGTQQIGPFDCDDTPRDSKHGPRKRI